LTLVPSEVARVALALGYTGGAVLSHSTGFAQAETPANWVFNWSTLTLPHWSQQSYFCLHHLGIQSL